MGGWWTRARPERRIQFAVLAIAIWIVFTGVIVARHPHGADWLFVVAAPFYITFFVAQIRRGHAERSLR